MPIEEARTKAEEWGVQYVETLAKTRANVDKVFFDLRKEIRAKKNVREQRQEWQEKQQEQESFKERCCLI